jgi:hypothetical protein
LPGILFCLERFIEELIKVDILSTYTKVCILEHQIEAQILDDFLTQQNIPHYIKSFYSEAYDGLFQFSSGWGAVFAPPVFHQEIKEIISDLRKM